MKANKLLFAAAIMLTAIACQEKDNPSGTDYQEMTFSASVASVQGVDLKFAAGESISVFDGKANQKFTATSATSFTGTANAGADAFMAIYPYNASYKRSQGKVSVDIPASQKATAGSIDPSGNFQVAYAKTSADPFAFAFMPAVIKLNVAEGNDIVSIQVAADGDEQLSGSVSLDLSETPKCEAAGGSNKVTLTGSNIGGTLYIAAVPANVSSFTVSFTNTADSRAEIKVNGAELKSGAVADLGSFNKFEWVEAENPNPTDVTGAVIVKASFKTADFNLVNDGGFEDYPNDTWYMIDPEATVQVIDGHNSSKAIRLDRLVESGTMTNLEQGCKWQKGTADTWWVFEFDARVSKDSKQDFYSGFGFYDDYGYWWKEVNGWAPSAEDVVENGRYWFNDEAWHHYVLEETCYMGQYKGLVHVGMWGNPNSNPCWSEYDNIIAYPKGYEYKGTSTDPAGASVLGVVTNATFDQVEDFGKVVAWMDNDGKVKLAFSNAVVNGNKVPTAIAMTESSDPSKIEIKKFKKSEGVISSIVPLAEGQLSVVPDDVFMMNGKTYMHYFTTISEGEYSDMGWITDGTGFAVSEDNGLTWTPASKFWAASAWANNTDGRFSNATFVNRDGYTYMIGSYAGRDNWAWGQSYAARVADGKDITDPDAYDYWRNPGWTDGGGEWSIDNTCPVLQGDRGTYDIIWNPKFQVYQLFYYADRVAGIVYRDSKGPDAEGNWYWSGAKLLTKNEDTGKLGSLSVLKVEEDGSVIFLGSTIK